MQLELDDLEMRDLREALDEHLRGMMRELVRTEDRGYRAALTAKYDRLVALSGRFEGQPFDDREIYQPTGF